MFLIFMKDIDEVAKVSAESILLDVADDNKLRVVVEGEEQRDVLQEAIKGLLEGRADMWQMEFDASPCHAMSSTKNVGYTLGGVELASVEEEKDVGVMIYQTMKPSLQCARNSARVNHVLGRQGEWGTGTRTPS